MGLFEILGLKRRPDSRMEPVNYFPVQAIDHVSRLEDQGLLYFDQAPVPLTAEPPFIPTHRHVTSGGLYRVTDDTRLEVTGDHAYRLVDYENEGGEKFAQNYDRFHDGRFEVLSHEH